MRRNLLMIEAAFDHFRAMRVVSNAVTIIGIES